MTYTLTHDVEFSVELDSILEGICRKLQLTKTQYDSAVGHYIAVGDWLDRSESSLTRLEPYVYPQGSLPMGTTNKPLERDEYDLDAVCELDISWQYVNDPDSLAKLVAQRLEEHGDYKERMELKPRCVRLIYAHNFHLDIVPACKNTELGEGQIRLPDGNGGWKDSNSKQFIKWFNGKSNLYQVNFQKQKICRFAESVPDRQLLEEKSPLQCAVQLIKRSRDMYFRNNCKLAPASIVLSTLCAKVYQGEVSVFDTVTLCLESINNQIRKCHPTPLVVINPANKAYENLGEKWNDPAAYKEFVAWIYYFKECWERFRNLQGISASHQVMNQLFGEKPTKEAFVEFSERMSQNRDKKLILVQPNGHLNTQVGITLPKNTFYGS